METRNLYQMDILSSICRFLILSRLLFVPFLPIVLDKILLTVCCRFSADVSFLPDSNLSACDSMTVIISTYGINFGVGTKFGPKFNKEVTFLSTVLPVRFNTLVSLSYVCYSKLSVNVFGFHCSVAKSGWLHTELRNKLCDVNFLIGKTLYCNFDSVKTSSTKVDEISQER